MEQKLICVPKVSLPWRRCEKRCGCGCAGNCRHRCAKTKVIKVLKVKEYECDTCKYTWKVYEPETPDAATQGAEQPALEPESETPQSNPEQPQYNDSQLYQPDGNDVPKAPAKDDTVHAILKHFRKR